MGRYRACWRCRSRASSGCGYSLPSQTPQPPGLVCSGCGYSLPSQNPDPPLMCLQVDLIICFDATASPTRAIQVRPQFNAHQHPELLPALLCHINTLPLHP